MLEYDIDYSMRHGCIVAKVIITRDMLNLIINNQLAKDNKELYNELLDLDNELYKENSRNE